jgi:hypothetical protein
LPTIEDPAHNEPEHMPKNTLKQQTDDRVQAFREAIDYRFTRFQAFYDLTNSQMRNYRLAQVESIDEDMMKFMRIFGQDLDYVRESIGYVNNVIDDVLRELGGTPNACLRDVQQRLTQNSIAMGTAVNGCTSRANRTVATQLADVFYPTFRNIQESVSAVPLFTINALSLGNVITDDQEILDYLQSQYEVVTMQWTSAVSQLFRWEKNRFEVEADFYQDEMINCMAEPIYQYSNTNTLLMFTAWDNCRP